jgi:putative hydrolase of the HAD superfamily
MDIRAIEWLLFDLGGVVLKVDQSRIFEELASMTGFAIEIVKARLDLTNRFWEEFTVREYTASELALQINRLLETTLSVAEVQEAFNAELGAPIQTTCELIPVLKQRVSVGCLSNTNSIHWDKLLSAYAAMQHFDRRFASQMLGHAKPSPEIYHATSKNLGVAAQHILFFDDRVENVSAAQALGWNARLYRDNSTLLSDLTEFGLL